MKSLFKQIKKLKLSKKERSEMREKLFRFTQNNPVDERIANDPRQINYLNSIFSNTYFLTLTHKLMPIAIIIALVITLGGGTAFAAENSLPGDALYPVKVNINEEVVSAFTLGTDNQAEWDAERAERRLQEAEQLAAEGKLDTETSAEIIADFNEHVEDVNIATTKLQTENKDEAAADILSLLESTLEAHLALLSTLSADTELETKIKIEIDGIKFKVEIESESTSDERHKIEIEMSSEDDDHDDDKDSEKDLAEKAEDKLKNAKHEIEESLKKINKIEKKLDSTELTDARALLEEAQTSVDSGTTLLEAEDYSAATLLFTEAKRQAKSAKSLAEATKKFEKAKNHDDDKDDDDKDHEDNNDNNNDDQDEDNDDDDRDQKVDEDSDQDSDHDSDRDKEDDKDDEDDDDEKRDDHDDDDDEEDDD